MARGFLFGLMRVIVETSDERKAVILQAEQDTQKIVTSQTEDSGRRLMVTQLKISDLRMKPLNRIIYIFGKEFNFTYIKCDMPNV